MKNLIKVVSLIRIPVKNHITSIENQYSSIDSTIHQYNLKADRSFELTGIKRPDIPYSSKFKELSHLLQSKDIAGVVVSDLARIIWKPNFQSLGMLQRFVDIGFKIYTGNGIVDSKQIKIAEPDHLLYDDDNCFQEAAV